MSRTPVNLIHALLGEHAVMRQWLLRILRDCHDQPVEAVPCNLTMLEDILTSHALFEDELIFNRLLTRKLSVSSVLESMRLEHDEIRARLAELPSLPPSRLRPRMEEFAEMVLEHFAVEERILFPLALSLLTPEELEPAGAEWARRRGIQPPGTIS